MQFETQSLVDTIREYMLNINKKAYIFSMSAPSSPDVARNGLLSQWRGYGVDGDYAIVFNYDGMQQLIDYEYKDFHYQHLEINQVHYYKNENNLHSLPLKFKEYEESIRVNVERILHAKMVDDDIYKYLASLSCLYKHWGFEEECEVRIIAIPIHEKIRNFVVDESNTKLHRQTKTFTRAGIPVPYVELFANLSSIKHLPITRVIVGPHKDKELRAEAVKMLLEVNGYKADDDVVVPSQIPYIGR